MDFRASSPSVRPTLPPLHTLDLPRGKIQLPRIDELYDSHEFKRQVPRLRVPSHEYAHTRQNRQVSISSSTSSRTPSPSSLSSCCPSTSGRRSTKMRLVPTTFEHADAVVLVLPPDAVHMHPLSGITNLKPAQPLLLVGPALQHLRNPQRQMARGARLHPYRIVRNPADRRFSIASAMPSQTLR